MKISVRPLQWVNIEGTGTYFSAPSAIGTYRITHYRGMKDGYKLEFPLSFSSYFDSLDEAKAASMADYEKIILSAIDLDKFTMP